MTKQDFMKNLKKALQWTMTSGETADILSDYDGFFTAGNADGKSEAEICAELGDPRDIALELSGDKKRRFKITTMVRMFVVFAAGAVMFMSPNFWVLYAGSSTSFNSTDATVSAIVTYLIIVTVMCIAVLYKGGNTNPRENESNTNMYICHGVVAFFVVLRAITDYILIETFPWTNGYPGGFFEFIHQISEVFVFTPLVIAIFAVRAFQHSNRLWFTVILHCLGAIGYYPIPHLRFPADSLFNNQEVYYFAFAPIAMYAIAVAVTVGFALLIRRKAVT
jgi:hypothetical protein